MKTKLLALLLAVLFLFSACGKNDISAEPAETSTEAESEYTSEMPSAEETKVETSADADASQTTQQGQSKQQPSPSPETAQPVETSSSAPQHIELTPVPTTSAQQATASENEKITVTFSVKCHNAINYGILSQGSFAQVLPADGIILRTSSIEVKNGESVMSALKKILKENRITYSIASSGYVRTISGLSEFDCGPYSGWMYKVNGNFPNVSTKSYPLREGDRVEFVYTCNMGDV